MRRIKYLVGFVGLFALLGLGPVGCTPGVGGSGCCRVCSVGKPCGDSCISAGYTCNKGAGCACYGNKTDQQLASK